MCTADPRICLITNYNMHFEKYTLKLSEHQYKSNNVWKHCTETEQLSLMDSIIGCVSKLNKQPI